MTAPLPPGFWAKTQQTNCIVWTGAQNSKGYGCYAVNGKSQLAHRLAWENINGPIPDGMTIDHRCRVHACVRLDHLELVTSAENTRRQPRVLRVGGVCRYGHSLDSDEDIYHKPNVGTSECRACKALHAKAYRTRKAATAS